MYVAASVRMLSTRFQTCEQEQQQNLVADEHGVRMQQAMLQLLVHATLLCALACAQLCSTCAAEDNM